MSAGGPLSELAAVEGGNESLMDDNGWLQFLPYKAIQSLSCPTL